MIKLFLLHKSRYSYQSVQRMVQSIDTRGVVIYNRKGQAVIAQADLFLNISHSGEWVVIGVGKERIGIDIQRYKGKSRDFIEYVTGEAEMSLPLFSKIWSIKECFVKWLGTGWVGIEPNEIYIDFNLQKVYSKTESAYFITTEIFESYIVWVCSELSSILKERIIFE